MLFRSRLVLSSSHYLGGFSSSALQSLMKQRFEVWASALQRLSKIA